MKIINNHIDIWNIGVSNKKGSHKGSQHSLGPQILSYFLTLIKTVFAALILVVVAFVTTYLILPWVSGKYNVMISNEQLFELLKIIIPVFGSGLLIKELKPEKKGK